MNHSDFTIQKFTDLYYSSSAAELLTEDEREEISAAIENEDLDFLEGIYMLLQNEAMVSDHISEESVHYVKNEWNNYNNELQDIYHSQVLKPQKEAHQKAEDKEKTTAEKLIESLD